MCLARRAVDRLSLSTTIMSLLFSLKDDLRSATGNEMVLNFCAGGEGVLGCVGTRAASASGWRCVLACTLYGA